MNRTSMLSLAVTLALVVGACASSGQAPGQIDSSRDFAEMKERILELQEQAAVTQVEMERLRSQVADLERRLAGQGSDLADPPARSSAAPLRPAPVPFASSRPSQPSIEESDLDPVPGTGLENSQDRPSSAAPAAPSGLPVEESTSPVEIQPVDAAAQALYDRGYTLYHQGQYLDAEASFQRFLQAYPSTELSDNAQFWIGEARYARGDIRGALAAFREVIQKYSQGNKVADSLIKEGDCLEKLGDRDGARDRYNEVKRRFPDSGAAVMADDRLAGLDG